MKFILGKFGRVFITFDLDAATELKPALQRIGLKENVDFCSIGLPAPGSDCIEGLVPASVKASVYAANTGAVAALGSVDSSARREAKSKLKKCLLEEFKNADLCANDIQEFRRLFSTLGKQLS